jgi:NAD(P)H-hydrate epimerase
VHAVAPAETIAQLVQAEPDVQTFSHPFDTAPSAELLELVEKADALAIGPGLGRNPGRRAFVSALVQAANRVIIDADGLVAFGGAEAELRKLADGRSVVLTPHPGEFRTLFPALASTRELDPWAAATQAAERSATTLLLKGVPTVIASSSRAPLTVAAGNPGLATGGSGDILTGLVGANLAQGLEPMTAAAVAAQALGSAADIAARRFTARGVRPMDVVAALPDVWRDWEMLQSGRTPSRPPLLLELPRPQTV